MPEVGVSLALRRHRNLIGSKGEGVARSFSRRGNDGNLDHTTEARSDRRTNNRKSSRTRRRVTDHSSTNQEQARNTTSRTRMLGTAVPGSSSSWQLLLEGASLYGFCMAFPGLCRVVVRVYTSCWEPGGILYQLLGNICTLSWLSRFGFCRRFLPDEVYAKIASKGSVLAPDAGISDVAIVVFLSLTMAVVRVLLVHFLVPNYKQPKRLEALVRCKSIHLLSSQYPGSITPRASISHRIQDLGKASVMIADLNIPNLHCHNGEGLTHDENSNLTSPDASDSPILEPLSSLLFHTPKEFPFSPNSSRRPIQRNNKASQNAQWLYSAEDQVDQSNGNWGLYDDDDSNKDEDDLHHNEAPAVSSGLLTNSSAQNLQALLEQAVPLSSSRRGSLIRSSSYCSVTEPSDRVFAAPKYATAVFRLMFCSFSCLVGLFFFGGANFWPPAVGGHGSTSKCWDLGSVGATVMDSDFDHRNAVLRRYYLIQASYHFHSAAFHVLTSLLLWFVSKTSKIRDSSSTPVFLGFIPAGMFTIYNLKTFFQHCFSIALILVTYLFSSTRRLGAIAMFTFDASSLFLHLLQMGINAPRKQQHPQITDVTASPQSNKLTSKIRMLHRLIVIPSFCYARFYVFPFVIAFSALEESQDWLRQLENMLVPGTAQYIHGFFVVAFLLFLVMNVVYFFRLLNHPHVKDTTTL